MTVAATQNPAKTGWRVLLATLVSRFAEYRARRRAVAELRSVDPRMLRDMAIDRSEVWSIAYGNNKERRRGFDVASV